MRYVAFSISTGACFTYYDLGRRDGGQAEEGVALASRLFDVNRLLLQATGDASVNVASRTATEPTAASGAGTSGLPPRPDGGITHGNSTILGAGIRRLTRNKSSLPPRLAVRQWLLDNEQWHLVEDPDTDLVSALSVPGGWPMDTAAHLATGMKDAYVQANRPQLLMASGEAAAAARTASAAGTVASDLAPRRPQLLLSSPSGVAGLLTLQALKLLCRLAQEGLDALVAGGMRPCWLYLVHVESFMGWQLRAPVTRSSGGDGSQLERNSSRTSAAMAGSLDGRADRSGSATREAKKRGLLRGVLGLLRSGSKGSITGSKADGREGSKLKRSGSKGSLAQGLRAEGHSHGPSEPDWQPGPVGALQHLVLPSEEETERYLGAHRWDAPSVAAAIMQAKPPEASRAGGAGLHGGRSANTEDWGEAGPLAFPDLEDVELEIEMKLGGDGASGDVRRFSVVAVRLQHVFAVMAKPLDDPSGQDNTREERGSTGSLMNQVRYLLRPSLVPMSSLFHLLARWVPQEDVATHDMLMRLLE